jgi:hypothetical protein
VLTANSGESDQALRRCESQVHWAAQAHWRHSGRSSEYPLSPKVAFPHRAKIQVGASAPARARLLSIL